MILSIQLSLNLRASKLKKKTTPLKTAIKQDLGDLNTPGSVTLVRHMTQVTNPAESTTKKLSGTIFRTLNFYENPSML